MAANAGPQDRTAGKLERARRREMVAVLVASHRTQRQIVEDLARQGISVGLGTVNNDIRVVRQEWMARAGDAYQSHVAEQTAQLDELLGTWLPRALGGGATDKAALVVLRTLERKARLLGLDRPVKAEVTGADGGPIEFAVTPELIAEGEAAFDELAAKRAARAG